MNKFLGTTYFTWMHIVTLPLLITVTTTMQVEHLVLLFAIVLGIIPTWFSYAFSNRKLILLSPFYYIWFPIRFGKRFVVTDPSDEIKDAYGF